MVISDDNLSADWSPSTDGVSVSKSHSRRSADGGRQLHRFSTDRRSTIFALAATIGVGWLAPALAGSSISTPRSSNDATRPFEGTATHVHIVGAARISGDEDQLAVTLAIDSGFHINANPASSDFLIPTVLNVVELKPLRIAYPEPIRFRPKFTEDTIDVYDGTILITAFFPKGALSSYRFLHGAVTAQACTYQFCLPPAELPLPPS